MPFRYLQNILLILLSSATFGVFAANIGTVTLDNGTTVLLHDDFTWEYIAVTTDTVSQTGNIHSPVAMTSSVVTASSATKATKNKSSLLHSGLLNNSVKNGVKVSYSEAIWQDQTLGLKFILSSNNTDGVVRVKVAVSFYDDNANKTTEQTVNVWQASYRLPDTYLRKGETRDSRVVWIDGIDKASWTNKLLSLKIVEIEVR